MPAQLRLSLACGRYDINRALIDGPDDGHPIGAHEQGFIDRPFPPETLFAPSTVDVLPAYV